MSAAAQVTEVLISRERIKGINKTVNHIQHNLDHGLKYPPLDSFSLSLQVYSNAAFASNSDMKPQIGFIILLRDHFKSCHVLDFKLQKNRRVTRSILGAEIWAFAEAFDKAFFFKQDN